MTDQLLEPWLDKRALAAHLSCSVRSIEFAMHDGMPYAVMFGRAKFQVSDVQAWLEHTGRLERRGNGDGMLPDTEMARRRVNADGP